MQALFIILGIYLLYTFIADFAIPVYKTSRRVHEQFKHMQQKPAAGEEPLRHSYNASANNREPGKAKTNSKDYIDFEEVKE